MWSYFRNAGVFFVVTVIVVLIGEEAHRQMGFPFAYTYRTLLDIKGAFIAEFAAHLALILSPIHTYVLRHERMANEPGRRRRSVLYGALLGSLYFLWLLPALAVAHSIIIYAIPATLCAAFLIGNFSLSPAADVGRQPEPTTIRPLPGQYLGNAAIFCVIGALVTTLGLALGVQAQLIPPSYSPALWWKRPLFGTVTFFLAVWGGCLSSLHTFLLSRVCPGGTGPVLRRSVGLAVALSLLVGLPWVQGEPAVLLVIPSALGYGWIVGFSQTRRRDSND